jgi:hypothetical protein
MSLRSSSRFASLCQLRPASCALAALLAALPAFVLSGTASAASPDGDGVPTAPPAGGKVLELNEMLTGEAKAEFAAAKVLYGDGDFIGASRKFRRVYAITPDVRLLWNIAVAEKQARHYAKARLLLRDYIASDSPLLSPADRAQAAEFMTATAPLVAEVTLTSNVAGSEIVVDDETVGVTPLKAPFTVDLGAHKLRVKHDGYREAVLERSLDNAAPVNIAVTLVAIPIVGRVVVTAGAADSILLDGAVKSVGRYDQDMAPGSHVLRVTHDGMVPYESHLEVVAGERRAFSVTLVPVKSGIPTWLWFAGGAVAAAGAGVGGYFLFRPATAVPPPAGEGSLEPRCIAVFGGACRQTGQ